MSQEGVKTKKQDDRTDVPPICISREEARKHKFTPSDFVHLHNHTTYSVLDGLTKVDDLIGKVKEFGMEAVAVTDNEEIGRASCRERV